MQTSVIKKRYWIVFSMLVSFSSAKALTTTVEPISINDGIWRVLSRVGNALDTLSPCMFGIQQTDMPLTITSPGYYCFNQNLIFTTTGIIIQSDNVTVDFNEHTLDGQNTGNGVGIQLTNGAQNIVIKNGAIQNISGLQSAGIADVNNGLVLNNIMIQDMSFINIGASAINLNSQTVTPNFNGLIIEHCNSYNGGVFQIVGDNIVIRSCILNNKLPFATTLYVQITGRGLSGLQGENVLVEDVILTSTFGLNGGELFIVSNWHNAELRNCQIGGGQNGNFIINNTANLRVSDCVSRFGSGVGFNAGVTATTHEIRSIVFERCVAQNMGGNGFIIQPTTGNIIDSAVFIDCIAQNCSQGFSANPASNLVMRNCTASQCVLGIKVASQGSATFGNNYVLENCVAQRCSTGGFQIGQAVAVTNQSVALRNCIAQQNTGIGFSVMQTSQCVIEGCIAQRNSTDGFTLAATTTNVEMIQCRALRNGSVGIRNSAANNFVFGCTSLGNTGGDYVGITDLTKIVSYSQIGATAAAKFWQNIKS